MSSLLNRYGNTKTDYIELAVLDESESYEVDITEIHYDPETKEFLLLTASGCSCWEGDYSEERFKSLKALGESMIKEDRQYNPSFVGAKQLLIEAEEAFKKYKNASNNIGKTTN